MTEKQKRTYSTQRNLIQVVDFLLEKSTERYTNSEFEEVGTHVQTIAKPEKERLKTFLSRIQNAVYKGEIEEIKNQLLDDGIHNLHYFREIDPEVSCSGKTGESKRICIEEETAKKVQRDELKNELTHLWNLYSNIYTEWNEVIDEVVNSRNLNIFLLENCEKHIDECIRLYASIGERIRGTVTGKKKVRDWVSSKLTRKNSNYNKLPSVLRFFTTETSFNRVIYSQISEQKQSELRGLLNVVRSVISNSRKLQQTNENTNSIVNGFDLICSNAEKLDDMFKTTDKIPGIPIDVHDGDTLKVNVMFPFDDRVREKFPVCLTVRCEGYDCAEITPKNKNEEDTLFEKTVGLIGKMAFSTKIGFNSGTDLKSNGIVHIKFNGQDKYGRILGVVHVKNGNGDFVNVNKYMLDSGFAYGYEGATKDCDNYLRVHGVELKNKFENRDPELINQIGGDEGYSSIVDTLDKFVVKTTKATAAKLRKTKK